MRHGLVLLIVAATIGVLVEAAGRLPIRWVPGSVTVMPDGFDG